MKNVQESRKRHKAIPPKGKKLKAKGKKGGKRVGFLTPFQVRADWLWLGSSLGRGDDARKRELCDNFTYVANHMRPHGSQAIVVATVTRNGKTNKYGKAEFLGFLRHKDPEMCPQGAQAFY